MKFLCPSCKAKYQIADEKVAGRSVRMKCRKCGYMIQISKAVTDGSVARKLPADDAPATPGPPGEVGGTPRPAPPAPSPPAAHSPSPPRAAARPPRPARASSPQVAPPPPRAAGRPHAAPLAAQARAQTSSPEPSPVAAPAAERDVHARGGAGSNGSAAALGLVRYDDDEERTMIAGAGALAGAFAQAVHAPESSGLPDLVGSEEWYVGINGVPVGPIRLSELRSKAASGAITEESLVWRDGFEQWMPLKTFPELVAIVDEGVSSARASLTPLSPDVGAEPSAQLTPMQDPFAAPVGSPGVGAIGDPFAEAGAPAASAATGPAVVTEKDGLGNVDLDALVPRRRGMSLAPWIAVVVALMFGLTIGFVVFSRQKPAQPIIKYVQVPAKGSEKSSDNKQSDQKADDGHQGDQKEPTSNGKTNKGGARGGGHATGSTDKPKEKGGGLSGLSGLSGLKGGPKVGPSGGSNNAAAGQPLDSSAVQRTVSRYTGSVKRSCWQPALDTREKNAPSSARVSVTIKVSSSGSVQGVSTSGDPHGYHGLAGCIASRVRGWQFPRSSGTTTVNVPFVFAAQ